MILNPSTKSRLKGLCWAAPLVALSLFIREKYGLDALHRTLPYLIGIPFSFGIVLVIRVFGRAYLKETTSPGRLKNIYLATVIVAWIVLMGISFFQQWIAPSLWQFLASCLLLACFVAPPFMRKRQAPPPDKAA
jgi:asparagine N-glycosylation enzyme membrane subunit Stt3